MAAHDGTDLYRHLVAENRNILSFILAYTYILYILIFSFNSKYMFKNILQ